MSLWHFFGEWKLIDVVFIYLSEIDYAFGNVSISKTNQYQSFVP